MTEARPPANWYPDPENPSQQRYWDGTAWTEHRAPRAGYSTGSQTGSQTGDSLARAGNDLAEGVASAFTAAEGWFRQQSAARLTFDDVAARCRDDVGRPPFSRTAELVVRPVDVDPVRRVFADAGVPITAEGSSHDAACRLVPNPWDPAHPGDVAVLVGPHRVGLLPPDVAAAYSPALVALTQRQLLAVAEVTLRATWTGVEVAATATVRLPEVAALA